MSSYRSNINDPSVTGSTKRQRRPQNDGHNHDHHNRCVLLFDMDCFYAQCEQVRLGLPLDVKLCLFQWNSVLAVTYPARELGIKRGDSWDDVAAKVKTSKNNTISSSTNSNNTTKDNNECYTIHLPILGHEPDIGVAKNDNHENDDKDENSKNVDDSIEASYRRNFELSREEQLRCQKTENRVRRFHRQGKACLERYRLASMRIFAVVLESLQKRITQQSGYSFILERASIDEFYLDLTDYCYCRNQNKNNDYTKDDDDSQNQENHGRDKTVVAGRKLQGKCYNDNGTDDPLEIAMNRACRVSYWIRQDIWNILGFTMSAGISTNKTMAKLTTSYGKPNGQAVLYPKYFINVLAETKITKVRNFGGKFGKTVLKLISKYQQEQPWNQTNESDADALVRLKSTATMGDLSQIPLPFLIQSKSLSKESANFIFSASHGIDHEEVKETSGALVKSITAFKSFMATKSHAEIFDRWLNLLATEIIERVTRDTVRNKRYPKSCTLNFTYYTTPNGQRPSTTTGSTRSQRQNRSLRLCYPSEREGTKQQKSVSLLAQAKAKLIPIVKDHPLRGVGLAVSNFIESTKVVHRALEGTVSVQSFFASKTPAVPTSSLLSLCTAERGTTEDREVTIVDNATSVMTFPRNNKRDSTTSARTRGTTTKRSHSECAGIELFPSTLSTPNDPVSVSVSTAIATSRSEFSKAVNPSSRQHNWETTIKKNVETLKDKDLNYARKLQASFDRENYALSTANRRQKSP